MNNQNISRNQIRQLLFQKISEGCDNIESKIVYLSQQGDILQNQDRKKVEDVIKRNLIEVEKLLIRFPNVDLTKKYTDLKIKWQEYMMGMELKSRQEEEFEADLLLNDIMKKYNDEQYGDNNKGVKH